MPRRRAILAALALVLTCAAADAAPRWGWLGVRIRELSDQEVEEISKKFGLREGFGAVIVEVLKEAPAEMSGLQPGDVVVAVRGKPVVDTRTLQRFIAGASIGETLPITVLRRNEGRRPLSVRLGPMPDNVVAERVAAEYGFSLRDTEGQPEIGGSRPPAGPPSVGVVLPKSRAELGGLKSGDILVEIAGRPVDTVGAAREALMAIAPQDPLALVVLRGEARIPIALERARSL